jgi:hypothetical protein
MPTYVFCSDSGEIYSSPNRIVPPDVVPSPNDRISLRDTRSLQWSRQEYPFLAWAPANVKFTGPILGRLACTYKSVRLCSVGPGWRLNPEIEVKWARLERALAGLVGNLEEPHRQWKSYAWPYSFKYREDHHWEDEARRAIMMSRDAFVPLIALCSWLLAKNSNPPPPQRPSWVKTVVDKYDVSPEWVDELMESQIGNLHIPRVGVIINPYRFSYDEIPLLQYYDVPVWIWWGKVPALVKTIAEPWRPDQASAMEAWKASAWPTTNPIFLQTQQHGSRESSRFQTPGFPSLGSRSPNFGSTFQPQSPVQPNVTVDAMLLNDADDAVPLNNADDATPLNNADCFGPIDNSAWLNNTGWPDSPDNSGWTNVVSFRQPPPPPGPNNPPGEYYPGSRQQVNESCHEYLARRQAELPGQIASATPTKQQQCADRLRASSSHAAPGRRGALVYHWEQMTHTLRLRTLVRSCDVESTFYDYGPNQRVFDPFYNEWDICSELAPDDIPTDVEIARYMGTDEDEDQGSSIPPNTHGDPIDYNLDLAEGLHVGAETGSKMLQFDDLSTILYTRYGIIRTANSQPSISLSANEIETMGRIIGNAQTGLAAPWQGLLGALIKGLAHSGNGMPPSPPLRDLDDFTSITNLIRESNVMVTQLEHEFCKWILLEGREFEYTPTLWKIVVSDAASALQCLRGNWGPRDSDIVRNLCQRGIRFHSLTPIPPSYYESLLRQPSILPRYRRHGYKPDPVAYMAYEDKRDELLKLPHARAALTMGGIVWRLSIEVIGLEKVLTGPSADAWKFGSRHHARGMGTSCEDALSEDELDLICGVYKTYNSKSPGIFRGFTHLMSASRPQRRESGYVMVAKAFDLER